MEKSEFIIKEITKLNILNKLKINDSFISNKIINLFDNLDVINTETELFPLSETEYIYNTNIIYKIDNDIYISLKLNDELSNECIITDIVFFYTKKENIDKINNIIEELKKGIFDTTNQEEEIKNDNLFYISIDKNGFFLNKLYLNTEIDFNISYNKKTLKELKKISKEIKNNSGLWALEGKRGLGKTTALKFISDNNLDKKFIYIPNILIDNTINSIDIFEFILNNGNCVFILDDIETFSNSFDLKANHLIQNISQFIDSFLFEENKVSFMIISNEEESEFLENLETLNNFKYKVVFEDLENSNISNLLELKKYKNVNSYDKLSLNEILNNKKSKEKKYKGF
jgi:hypothetical protein